VVVASVGETRQSVREPLTFFSFFAGWIHDWNKRPIVLLLLLLLPTLFRVGRTQHIDALLLSQATDSSCCCFYFCFHSRHASSWSSSKLPLQYSFLYHSLFPIRARLLLLCASGSMPCHKRCEFDKPNSHVTIFSYSIPSSNYFFESWPNLFEDISFSIFNTKKYIRQTKYCLSHCCFINGAFNFVQIKEKKITSFFC
jgi:hypothetical protein